MFEKTLVFSYSLRPNLPPYISTKILTSKCGMNTAIPVWSENIIRQNNVWQRLYPNDWTLLITRQQSAN